MDKEFIVTFLNKVNKSANINIEEAVKIITDYCIDNNKKTDDINLYINAVIQSGLLSYSLHESLDYYKRKYNICEVKDKNNNILLIF